MDDFLTLQNQLALMVGADTVRQLPLNEQVQIQKCINEAYTSCYVPEDGLRPPWASQHFAVRLHGASELEVTVTKGGTEIVSPDYVDVDPDFLYAGSLVKIGDNHYTRTGQGEAPAFQVLEPVQEADGTYTATFYFNSFRLDAQAIDVIEKPELAGEGVLSPMDGKGNELLYRSLVVGDFHAKPSMGYQHNVQFNSPMISLDVGRPIFYFVDSASYTGAFQYLFGVYPIPYESRLIRFRANIVPLPLEEDDDLPVLPPNMVDTVLLPIATYRYCSRTRRYNGDNRSFLRDDAQRAQQRLRSFRTGQKNRGARLSIRNGYA